MDKTKIFVSYSHKDMDWVSNEGEYKLIAWLSDELKDDAIIWTDHALQNLVGKEFKQHIFSRIKESSIVILLLSQNFVSSKFIMDAELPFIKELLDEKKIKILPILLTDLSISSKQKISWIFDLQIYPGETKTLIEFTQDKNLWIKKQIGILNNIQTRIANLNGFNQFSQKETENLVFERRYNFSKFNRIKTIAIVLITILTIILVLNNYIIRKDRNENNIITINYYHISNEEKADSYFKDGNRYFRKGDMNTVINQFEKALKYESRPSNIRKITKRLAFAYNKISETTDEAIAYEETKNAIVQKQNVYVSKSNVSSEK